VIPLDTLTPSIAAHLRWMMRSKRHEPSTIRRRYRELVALERIVGAPLDQVHRDRLGDWYGDLTGARTTAKAKLSHARSYFRWCIDHDLIDRDPTRGIAAPRVHRGTPRPLDPDVVLRTLERLYGPAHWAVALMVWCGIRCDEAVQVHPARDIVPGPDGPELVVHGKGHNLRQVAIPEDLAQRLSAAAGDGWLFPSRSQSGHWSASYMSDFVSDHLGKAGINGTGHQLRHTYLTWLYRRTGDLLATGRAAGHRSTAATQVYADAAPIPRDVMARLYTQRRRRTPTTQGVPR
jgi:integrase